MKKTIDIEQPSKYQLAYEALTEFVPSAKTPHLDALEKAGLLETLPIGHIKQIVVIAQAAYQRGKADAGAEKIDNEMVWLDGMGGLERQTDGTWRLTAPDKGVTHIMAAELGRIGGSATSEAKTRSSSANGRLGGRPRKTAE